MTIKTNTGLLLTRLIIGIPMLLYGLHKLNHGIDFISGLLLKAGFPGFLAYGVYVGEIFAPLMIIVGFRTRLAGLIFAANCFMAILLAQSDKVFSLNEFGGWALELLGIYLTIGLVLFFMGGGRYGLSAGSKWD